MVKSDDSKRLSDDTTSDEEIWMQAPKLENSFLVRALERKSSI